MAKAYVLDYDGDVAYGLDGSASNPDRFGSRPERVIFVPSISLCVRLSTGLSLPVVVSGREVAQSNYDYTRALTPGLTPQEIDVPESFVQWAKSVLQARNPPAELSDLLRLQ